MTSSNVKLYKKLDKVYVKNIVNVILIKYQSLHFRLKMAKNQCLIELQKLKDSALTNLTLSSSEVYDLADLINRRQPRRVRVEWKQEKKAEMREFLEGLEEIFTKLAVTCEGKNDEQVNKRQ